MSALYPEKLEQYNQHHISRDVLFYLFFLILGMSIRWIWHLVDSPFHQPMAPVLASSASSARFDPCARSMRCRRWRRRVSIGGKSQQLGDLINRIRFLSLQQVDFTKKKCEQMWVCCGARFITFSFTLHFWHGHSFGPMSIRQGNWSSWELRLSMAHSAVAGPSQHGY